MNFGKRVDETEAKRIVAHALEIGVTTFDTANAYGDGESERILGRALRKVGGSYRIATKVGLARVDGKVEGLAPTVIEAAVEQSLTRLGVERIDLYYLHAPDAQTPIEDSLDALGRLLQNGKIAGWGVSNFAAWQILEIDHLVDAAGMPRPAVSQVLYNVLMRELEIEYLPFCRRYPCHTTVYNPLAGGLLTGTLSQGQAAPKGSRFATNPIYRRRYLTPRMFERVESLRAIADAEGVSLLVLAYAWLAARPGVDSILVGPASCGHLEDAALAISRKLSPECLQKIEALHQRERGSDTVYAR